MLPVSGSKRDNGVGNISSANTSVLATVVWFALSLLLMVFGVWHCYASSFSDSLVCNEIDCRLTIGDLRDSNYVFHRSDINHVEMVRVDDDNKVVSWYHLDPAQSNKLGFNTEVKFLHASDGDRKYQIQKQVLVSHRSTGRLKSKDAYNQIFDYMQKKSDSVHLVFTSHLSVIGVLSVAFGSMSMLMSFLAGQWSDPVPRRMKKQY